MSEIRRIEPVRGVSGSISWLDDETDEFDDDDNDLQCPYCDYNGYSSHYHCGRCGEESSMMGHWREIDTDVDGVSVKWRGFTCDVNNEREAEEGMTDYD